MQFNIIPSAMFAASGALFLWWLWNEYKYKEPLPEEFTEDAPPEEFTPPERIQEYEEYTFYTERCKTLRKMLQAAAAAENKANDNLLSFYEFNQYGQVISDRVIKRAENELYTAQQKRLRIENQLQTARRGQRKALQAINKTGI